MDARRVRTRSGKHVFRFGMVIAELLLLSGCAWTQTGHRDPTAAAMQPKPVASVAQSDPRAIAQPDLSQPIPSRPVVTAARHTSRDIADIAPARPTEITSDDMQANDESRAIALRDPAMSGGLQQPPAAPAAYDNIRRLPNEATAAWNAETGQASAVEGPAFLASEINQPPVQLVSQITLTQQNRELPAADPARRTTIAQTSPRSENRRIIHVTDASFDEQVLRSNVPVLVDFYANWCGPCKALAPTLQEIASESENVRIVKVNVDENPRLADRYNVKTLPSLMVFKDGRVVAKQKGVVSKPKLLAMLDL